MLNNQTSFPQISKFITTSRLAQHNTRGQSPLCVRLYSPTRYRPRSIAGLMFVGERVFLISGATADVPIIGRGV